MLYDSTHLAVRLNASFWYRITSVYSAGFASCPFTSTALRRLTRDVSDHLTDRYSERVETAAELSARVNLSKAVDAKGQGANPAE